MKRALNVVIAVVVAVGGLGIAQLLGQLQRTKRQLLQSQQDVTRLTNEQEAATQQLGELQSERKKLQERLESLQAQLATVNVDLERSRAALQEQTGRQEQFSRERERLQADVAHLTQERDEAQKNVSRLEDDNTELERGVKRLRARLSLLDRDYKHLADQFAVLEAAPHSGVNVVTSVGPLTSRSLASVSPVTPTNPPPIAIPGTVELPPIIVHKDQAMMATPIRGRLLEVSDEHNFVILDKGSQDGVQVGMTFDIVRGSSSVGRATVVRVRPKLAACDLVRDKSPGPIQPGDLTVQRGP